MRATIVETLLDCKSRYFSFKPRLPWRETWGM